MAADSETSLFVFEFAYYDMIHISAKTKVHSSLDFEKQNPTDWKEIYD